MNQYKCDKCRKIIKNDRFYCLECEYQVWNFNIDQYCQQCYDDIYDCINCQEYKKHFKRDVKLTYLKDIQLTNKNALQDIKIIQNNLLYIIGLPHQIASEETLMKNEYLGQYGSINKIISKRNGTFHSNIYAAYVTFNEPISAALALLGTNEFQMNHSTIKSSYGTTKYCSFFLKGQSCPKSKQCVYLHSHPDKETQILSKDEKVQSKWLNQHSIRTAREIVISNWDIVMKIRQQNEGKHTVFESLSQIIERYGMEEVQKDVVEELEEKILDLCSDFNQLGGSRFKFADDDECDNENTEDENLVVIRDYAKSLQA